MSDSPLRQQTESRRAPGISAHQLEVVLGGRSVLADLNLEFRPGEFVSIVGPSGCGKSTLLRVVAGLIAPSGGKLSVATPAGREQTPRLGFVFQHPTLLPWRTAARNVALPLELSGESAADLRQRIDSAMQAVGLEADDFQKLPGELSGGMQMRVSLARAMVTDPDAMLLDEPLAALDELLREQLGEELAALWERRRWTTLLVTHHVAEAVFLSSRVLVLAGRPGRLVGEVEVPFSYPRLPKLRAEADFARLVGEVSDRLRKGAA